MSDNNGKKRRGPYKRYLYSDPNISRPINPRTLKGRREEMARRREIIDATIQQRDASLETVQQEHNDEQEQQNPEVENIGASDRNEQSESLTTKQQEHNDEQEEQNPEVENCDEKIEVSDMDEADLQAAGPSGLVNPAHKNSRQQDDIKIVEDDSYSDGIEEISDREDYDYYESIRDIPISEGENEVFSLAESDTEDAMAEKDENIKIVIHRRFRGHAGSSSSINSDHENSGQEEESHVASDPGVSLHSDREINETEENDETVEENVDTPYKESENEIFTSGESDHEDITPELKSENDDSSDENVEVVNRNFGDLMSYLSQHGYFSNWNPKISLAEILLLFLTVFITHNLSLAAMVDIMKVLNVIMNTTLFSTTTYFFKKYFNPKSDIKLYVVCEKCGHYLGEKKSEESIMCEKCNFINVMKGYKSDYTFAVLDIKSQLGTIITNNYYNLVFRTENNSYSDIHDGSMYGNLMPKSTATDLHLSTMLNVGTPVVQDSITCIWPIYLMLNELDVKKRKENLILAGIWYGHKKPKMDDFLRPLLPIFNDLSRQGFLLNIHDTVVQTKISTICCCVDSTVRAPMQGLTDISGFGGCSWCRHKGEIVAGTVKYPVTGQANQRQRTDENFKQDVTSVCRSGKKVNGVTNTSSLLGLHKFSIVWGFFPDYVDCVLHGTVKRFLESWFSGKGNAYYIGGKEDQLDNVLLNIRPPSILKHKPLELSCRKNMTSRELENWLLFYSVPVLIGSLPTVYLNHWKLLVKAIYILLQDQLTVEDINVANDLLNNFMEKTESLYGKYEMTHSIHQLRHLAESTRRWGPMWARCGLPFESETEKLKQIVQATNSEPDQILQSFELSQARKIILNNSLFKRNVIETCEDIQSYKIKSAQDEKRSLQFCEGDFTNAEGIVGLPINYQNIKEYAKMVRNGVVYSKSTMGLDESETDNSYVELENGSFGQLKHVLLVYSKNNGINFYVVLEQLFVKQVDGLDHMFKIICRGDTTAHLFSMVKCAAVHVKSSTNEFVCKIPEKHVTFNL